MFFFIGGVQPRTRKIGEGPPRTCPRCGRSALELRRTDQYLSVFFIPLFPIKRGRPYWGCAECGAVFDDRGRTLSEAFPPIGKTCRYCGRPAQSDFEYCPYCGKPLDGGPVS